VADLECFTCAGSGFPGLAERLLCLAEPDQGDHRGRTAISGADEVERTGVLVGGIVVPAEAAHDAAKHVATVDLGPQILIADDCARRLRFGDGLGQPALVDEDSGVGGQYRGFRSTLADLPAN
jgi:hypothetical protein